MGDSAAAPRRVRVERGIYRRPTGVLEVGFKDETGRQRWRTVDGGILAARKLRDDLAAKRARGESIAPKPKLRFGEAAEQWLGGPVLDLRETTQAKYRCIVNEHLRPRFEARRLDALTADDLACLVRELRGEGKSEATIVVALGVVGSVYRFAARRLGWSGTIPTTLMLRSERPKIALVKRRPIFVGEQLEQTIAAAHEPFRTLFIVAALTGARISELCALAWANIRIDAVEDAEIEFGWQVDRRGNRRPTKTDGSARTVPIPPELATILHRHRLAARDTTSDDFVFASGTGRPLQQRNVGRALREAQSRAVDADGQPTFPVLHQVDDHGDLVPIPRGVLASMHSFRHTVASRALLAGESVDEVAFLLGHRDGTVTRTVYVREVADARRRTMRRSRMAAEFGGALRVALDQALRTPDVNGGLPLAGVVAKPCPAEPLSIVAMTPERKRRKKRRPAPAEATLQAVESTDPGPPYLVLWHPGAEKERDALWPTQEIVAMEHAVEKLRPSARGFRIRTQARSGAKPARD
jgi:integrase